MAEKTNIKFSRPHGREGEPKHIDTYRQQSDSPNVEKIAHTDQSPGYDGTKVDIPVNTDSKSE